MTSTVATAKAEAITIAQSNAEEAIAAALLYLQAIYETITGSTTKIATAKAEAITVAQSNAAGAIAAAIQSLEAVYQTITGSNQNIATAKAEAISTAASNAAGAIATAIASLEAVYETITNSVSRVNTARTEAISIATANAQELLAGFIQSFLATGAGGTAEGRIRFVAVSAPGGVTSSISMEVNAGTEASPAWRPVGQYMDATPDLGRIRQVADLFLWEHPSLNGGAPFPFFTMTGGRGVMHGDLSVQTLESDIVDTQHLRVDSVPLEAIIVGAVGLRSTKATTLVANFSGPSETLVSHDVFVANPDRIVRAYLSVGNVDAAGGPTSGPKGHFTLHFYRDGVFRGSQRYDHDVDDGGTWKYTKVLQTYFEYDAMPTGSHNFAVLLVNGGTTTIPAGKFTIEEMRR